MRLAAAILMVGGLVFLAHLFAVIFSRTRIPDVLWLLLIGVALGPLGHLLTPAALGVVGPAFVSITLVLILFESGLTLQFARLRRALPGTLALSSASFLGEAVVVALATWAWTPLGAAPAVLLGVVVAGNSPTVIVPLAKGLSMGDHARDILFLESAFGDVASIVLALALLNLRLHGWNQWLPTAGHFVLGFGGAVLLGAAGGLAWSLALRHTRGLENAMFTTPAAVFMLYGGAELIRANGAMAVLAFGVVLGNVEHSWRQLGDVLGTGGRALPGIDAGPGRDPRERSQQKRASHPLVREPLPAVGLNQAETGFLGEIVFLLKTFFFVYIGLSVKFADLRWLLFGALLSLLLLLPRVPAVRLALRHRVPARDAALAACMIPKGLAAAVLAEFLVQQGVPGADTLQSIIYAMIFFGVVFTSLLVFVVNRPRGHRAMGWLLGRAPDAR